MQLSISGPARSWQGAVAVPGDKSISHRALIFGALAEGTSHVHNFLHAGVTEAMIDCVRALGVAVEVSPNGDLTIKGGHWRPPAAPLDCRGSGATMRLLLGALAGRLNGSDLAATLTGSPGLLRRPMGRVADPLRQMGAQIEGSAGANQPPLRVRSTKLHGIDYTLPVASAQVKTALLIAALSAEGPTTLHEPGPSRDHTERMLSALGMELATWSTSVTLTPAASPLPAFSLDVPGDFSSAAFPLIAALIVPGSQVMLHSVGINPTRTGLLDALAEMGAAVAVTGERDSGGEPVGDLGARSRGLRGCNIHGDRVVRMIDEFPIFAVAATQAEGETVVRDAAELRLKESDRIASLVGELQKMGARIEARPDGFRIEGPTRLRGAHVDSYGDHRLAMALAVAGLVAEGETMVSGAECIGESFPNFVELMQALETNLDFGLLIAD
ncbi:MAG TPA: 3-phosphoshikimate 1-carboxyvinyltransferase [Anaerolineae bacterium]|nr:3-phosphoshikimate 1-carboxyvinyltransferase [Anaerolineae bacterium]